MLVACRYLQLAECHLPLTIRPRMVTSGHLGNATDDYPQPMCLNDPFATATGPCTVPPLQTLEPKEKWKVPITESPVRINHAQESETQHTAASQDDNYEVPMMPLESVLRNRNSPARNGDVNSHTSVWDCQAVPWLA